MMDMFTRMWPKKKTKNNSATIAGAVSLAALSGAQRENEFLYNQDHESQP